MDALTLLLIAPLVLVGEAALVGYLWARPLSAHGPRLAGAMRTLYGSPVGIGILVLAWLLLTAVAFVYEFFFGLIVLYGLIFTGGRLAGWLGILLMGAVFVSTPGLCGWLVLRAGRRFRVPREPGARPAALRGLERLPSP